MPLNVFGKSDFSSMLAFHHMTVLSYVHCMYIIGMYLTHFFVVQHLGSFRYFFIILNPVMMTLIYESLFISLIISLG